MAKHSIKTTAWGLSEDEQHYCLVKREGGQIKVAWQEKPCELGIFISQRDVGYERNQPKIRIVRPVPYHYIWRKMFLLPSSLTDIQCHQKIIQILNNEQPLPLEKLYFDYQTEQIDSQDFTKLTLFALNKDYAKKLEVFPSTVLDCELYCYMRAIAYLKKLPKSQSFPPFIFKQQRVEWRENGFTFSQPKQQNDINLDDIELEIEIESMSKRHLYFLALGASLWNGKV